MGCQAAPCCHTLAARHHNKPQPTSFHSGVATPHLHVIPHTKRLHQTQATPHKGTSRDPQLSSRQGTQRLSLSPTRKPCGSLLTRTSLPGMRESLQSSVGLVCATSFSTNQRDIAPSHAKPRPRLRPLLQDCTMAGNHSQLGLQLRPQPSCTWRFITDAMTSPR